MRSVRLAEYKGAEAAAAASRRIAKVRATVKPAEAGCPHPPAALSAAIAKTAKSPSLDIQNNITIINHFTRLEKPL